MPQKQVDKSAYAFEKYGGVDRFASYAHQLAEIFDLKPKSVLEVGVGDKVVANYIKTNTGISYQSLDVADDVGADILGTVTHIPLPDKSVDVACAFEVLEHLPFSEFESALKEMGRVARFKVLISIPHFGPPVKLLWKIPFLPEMRMAFKVPFPKVHEFNGQHYWEVGKRGYSRRRVREVVQKHFVIDKEYVPFENQYHRFYVLTPR